MADKKTSIVVTIDDTQAKESLSGIIRQLEKATELAGDLNIGGGRGGADSTSGGGGSGGMGPGGPSTGGSQGGQGQPGPNQHPSHSLMYRGVTGVGGAAVGGGERFMTSQEPGAPFKGVATAMEKAIRSMTDAAMDMIEAMPTDIGATPIYADIVNGLAAVAKVAALAAGAYGRILGEGLNLRFQNLSRVGQLERTNAFSRETGMGSANAGSGNLNRGARFGYAPQEASAMAAAFGRSRGTSENIPFENLYMWAARGVSPEMIARYAGLGTSGGGATQGVAASQLGAEAAMSTAMRAGLSGSKVDEYLARIAATTTQMAEGGLQLDLDATNLFHERMQQLDQSSGGRFGMSGMDGPRITQKLIGGGMGARQMLAAPFQQLGQMAILSNALGQTSDPLQAIGLVEQMMQDPETLGGAVHDELGGGQTSALAFAGMGMSARQSEGLNRFMANRGQISDLIPQVRRRPRGVRGSFGISSTFASEDNRLLATAARARGNEDLIRGVYVIQQTLMELTNNETVANMLNIIVEIRDILNESAGGP